MTDTLRSPWLDRLDLIVRRIAATEPLHVDRIIARANPPSVAEFASELIRRSKAGEISIFYRVWANESEDQIADIPFHKCLPEEFIDMGTGAVRLGAKVDMMVKARGRQDSWEQ